MRICEHLESISIGQHSLVTRAGVQRYSMYYERLVHISRAFNRVCLYKRAQRAPAYRRRVSFRMMTRAGSTAKAHALLLCIAHCGLKKLGIHRDYCFTSSSPRLSD